MNAATLLLVALGLNTLGGFISLFFKNQRATARQISVISGLLGAIFALLAAIFILARPLTVSTFSWFSLPVFGEFTLALDGLSGLLVAMIALLSLATNWYSLAAPSDELNDPAEWRYTLGFFTNFFVAAMLLVVTTANAFYFLVFWEVMTLASYFLVLGGQPTAGADPKKASYLYILIAHAGGTLIMLGIFVLFAHSGSFDFGALRALQLPEGLRSLLFVLFFLGFGAKAGMAPLHFWMPSAYSAASPRSAALMASVMKKTAIYGLLRFGVDLLGGNILWWGLLVLFFGAISALWGVLFALVERDLKRLLAYSSVENVGIILMGIGTGMIGLAIDQPIAAALGFLAALYHSLNHSFFKGLLFLSAGAVEQQAGSQNLNQLGGLNRRMPWTALAFLTGAMAVAALPPLNGFVSEWYTYQAFFAAAESPIFTVRLFTPLCAVVLALVGAMAAMAFIKAYSGAFTGPALSTNAGEAREAPGAITSSLLFLAVGCLLLGLGAPYIASTPILTGAAAPLLKSGGPAFTVAGGIWAAAPAGLTFPTPVASAISPLLTLLLLSGLLIVPWILVAAYRREAPLPTAQADGARRLVADPWACGYGYRPVMSVTAASFEQPVKATFDLLFLPRRLVRSPLLRMAEWGKALYVWFCRIEPLIERVITRPLIRLVETLGGWIQNLATGDIRLYCLYIVVTLAILLVVVFR